MTMTPDAKGHLSGTIRGLRERLLSELKDSAEGAYRLSVPLDRAGLSEARHALRQRLDTWLDEQARTVKQAKKREQARRRFLQDVVKEAAYTLLNRLVVLRLLEAAGLQRPQVLSGGRESKGYREYRELARGLTHDDTEGHAFLLKLVSDELAYDLPGLYGPVGLTGLIPVPAASLRAVVDALNHPRLDSCWTDDTTLGWVYQYWNDPEREALDAKLNSGGKIEPHEIASKTQMFTERYMVEWLLQNSLGQMWLAMCKKHGWPAEVETHDVLEALEQRRTEWRARREAGEVALTDLMPVHGEVEQRWKYWVPQPMPDDAVKHAPESVRQMKILDPACGSGHFLVIAFDLLLAMYQEEARHRGEHWEDEDIARWIVEDNLHGVDIDPRAVQIAAAALYLKLRTVGRDVQPRRMNLVASNLRLASLPGDDPALVELRREVKEATGIPEALTDKIVGALEGADHLGTLLKVDQAVDEAIREHEEGVAQRSAAASQGSLFGGFAPQQQKIAFEETRASVMEGLETMLSRRTGGDDLGLRLRGEQLTAGIRFVRMVREGTYHLVVGNPPYQGTTKMAAPKYIQKHYPRGKADLYAAFLERGLQFTVEGGVSALLTMRNWMFIKQYSKLRQWLLETYDLRALGDFAVGAFDEVPNDVLSVAVSVFRKERPRGPESVALQPTPPEDQSFDRKRTQRKRAAVLCGIGRWEFEPAALKVVPEWPAIYWWEEKIVAAYQSAPLIKTVAPGKMGANLGNNARFLRLAWEVFAHETGIKWKPYIKGAAGKVWLEPLEHLVRWTFSALEVKNLVQSKFGDAGIGWKIANSQHYFQLGVAFSAIGSRFLARAHRFPSIFDFKGNSIFPQDVPGTVCALNTSFSRSILNALNPSVSFQVGDINRLPLLTISNADEIFAQIEAAFATHESHREASVEFLSPGPSPWHYAQDWAQQAVDRPENTPLPSYEPEYDDPDHKDFVSFAVGVAIGRFGADSEGILDQAPQDALPAGILFLSGATHQDSLKHPACRRVHDAWADHGADIAPGTDLGTWLRLRFFSDDHRQRYESRPIYFPLSSKKKTFVAYVSIHRWDAQTLRTLLADHLHRERTTMEGMLDDLRQAKTTSNKRQAAGAEKSFARVQKQHEELVAFIEDVIRCAEKGPPPPDSKTPAREVDATYVPDLDDGVMINISALWPLLAPQWNKPKQWWKELCTAKGRKDYDWSHLAARYFPTRVDAKCKEDPSLGVAHGCFWRYHPARAYAWELRLQDEIEPGFTINEDGSDEAREAFLRDHPGEAAEIQEKEDKRRQRARKKKQKQEAQDCPLFRQKK